MLTESAIKSVAAMTSSYTRGCQYYREGCVRQLYFDAQKNEFEAEVMGQELYAVSIQFDKNHELHDYECECPAYYNYDGACKHVIAVLKAIQHDWSKYFFLQKPVRTPEPLRVRTPVPVPAPVRLTEETQELLAFFRNSTADAVDSGHKIQGKLIPLFAFSVTAGSKTSWLEFSIGAERTYVLRNIPQMLAALEDNQEIVYGKSFTLKPGEIVFDDKSEALLDIMQQAHAEEKQRAAWNYYSHSSNSPFANPRTFKLTNHNLLRFFDVMGDQPFSALINNQNIGEISIRNGRPPVKLAVKEIVGGLSMSLDLAGNVLYGLDTEFRYIYHNKVIYKVDEVFSINIKPLLQCFARTGKTVIAIPTAAISDFVATVLPSLETIAEVAVAADVCNRFYKEPLEKHVYFDKFNDGMSARIELHYGDVTINPANSAAKEIPGIKDKWLVRSAAEESQLLNLFQRHGFIWSADKLVQPDEEATYVFLQEALPEICDIAEVFYSDDFTRIKLRNTGKITAGVRLNSETDMLDFSLQYEGMSPQELIELLAAYKLKKRYHRLQDGAFVPLDSAEFQTAAMLIDQLGLKATDIEKQVAELPKYRALYLDNLARETEDFPIERNSTFKKMVQDIREPQDIEYAVPDGIQGKLRDYQKTGFKWLKSLASYGLGGILADDMGLGKTLQVIAFVLSEKTDIPLPSLVIVPTSLVYNWQDEVQKFAPGLKVTVISGQQSERQEQFLDIDQADLVVTSYSLIKRDIQLYENKQFKYCFLDEAQHVKNPNTLNAKSVKKIKAKSYFALTGTPIENSLTELWSIFDFLMPGYLRTHKTFTGKFEIPIVKNGDQQALRELSRHIKPFILRRMKKAVLKELPPKIEGKLTSEMTGEQTRLYAAWLLKTRAEFESELQANGFEKSQIKILSLLTRLRQICCHPSLFIDNYRGGSGKLEMLQEIIKDAVSGGHRILLFSQFTGMLHLIKQELEAIDIPYHYLDGATKPEERIRLVHAFNSGEKDVFLISLKAGGTGLNLTGADMVIHYDPWWNPAVEDQATDRAYRIGQKNSVQVYKLIAKNTIEEKIYTLQQKKKEMIDTLIKPGENFLAKMSEAEIRKLFDI